MGQVLSQMRYPSFPVSFLCLYCYVAPSYNRWQYLYISPNRYWIYWVGEKYGAGNTDCVRRGSKHTKERSVRTRLAALLRKVSAEIQNARTLISHIRIRTSSNITFAVDNAIAIEPKQAIESGHRCIIRRNLMVNSPAFFDVGRGISCKKRERNSKNY